MIFKPLLKLIGAVAALINEHYDKYHHLVQVLIWFIAFCAFCIGFISLLFAIKSFKQAALSNDLSTISRMTVNEQFFQSGLQLLPSIQDKCGKSFPMIQDELVFLFINRLGLSQITGINLSRLRLVSEGNELQIKRGHIENCNFNKAFIKNVTFILNNWIACKIDDAVFDEIHIIGDDDGNIWNLNGSNALISNSNIQRTKMDRWIINNCRIYKTHLTWTNISECSITNTVFNSCSFSHVSFSSAFMGCSFINCEFDDCKFDNCILDNTSFVGGQLKYCSFNNTSLKCGIIFAESVSNCVYDGAYFNNVKIDTTVFRSSSFYQTRIDQGNESKDFIVSRGGKISNFTEE